MDPLDFAKLVRIMRQSQKGYFRSKGQEDLRHAKDAERRVDEALALILSPKQPSLFDEQPQ